MIVGWIFLSNTPMIGFVEVGILADYYMSSIVINILVFHYLRADSRKL